MAPQPRTTVSARALAGLAALLTAASTTSALALDAADARLYVKGDQLFYDTETLPDDAPDEIVPEDIARFREILAAHPDITELQLNSGGGSLYASAEIAWIVHDYGLDTRVDGECVSACVDIFLAGARRRMTLGSKIGFHRRSWSPQAVESYYEELRERQGWGTPFVFGSWIYEDTQREIYDYLSTLLARGVDAGFAIRTLQTDSGAEWYPSRLEMIAAGVLREEAR